MSTTTSKTRDASTAEETRERPTTETIVEATPSTKPLTVRLGLTFVLGFLVIVTIRQNVQWFGSLQVAEIAANLALLLTAIACVRLLVKLYILTRTRYVVTTTGVRREYTLLYRTWSRELPLTMIRGHELTRSRIETFFGVGTVEFLSGSVSGSIGHLRFSALPNPDKVRSAVQDQLLVANTGEGV